MDPSEFEDTVVKSNEIQTAGALEDLFGTAKPKFVQIDFNQETNDLYLQIFNAQECLSKWNDISLEELRDDLDIKATKIASSKEDYLVRKKALAAKVRAFTKAYLTPEDGTDDSLELSESSWVGHCTQLVQDFKVEFDFLAESAKYSELCFMALYKILHELIDPREIISCCLKVCLRAHEALKHASEQLAVAASSIAANQPNSSDGMRLSSAIVSGNSLASMEEMNRLIEQLEREKLNNDILQSDISDLRSRFEVEMRNREQSLRSTFERHQLDSQKQLEYALAGKDDEISSLMASISEYQHRSLESEQREKMAGLETTRRREVEDKLRLALAEVSETQYRMQSLQSKCDSLECRQQTVETQHAKDLKSYLDDKNLLQMEVHNLRTKCESVEIELDGRPPVDLSKLSERLGIHTINEDHMGRNRQISKGVSNWNAIEDLLVEIVRKAHSDAVESRIQEQDAKKKLAVAIEENGDLTRKFASQKEALVTLERDLLLSQSSSTASHPGPASVNPGHGNGQIPSHMIQQPIPTKYTTTAGIQNKYSSSAHISPQTAAVLAEASQQLIAAEAVLPGGSQERMVQTILNQRDRFMKSAADKDSELLTMKNKIERMQEEQMQLRGENLELYRRLRHLRVSSAAGPVGSSNIGSASTSRRGNDRDAISNGIGMNDDDDAVIRRGRSTNKRDKFQDLEEDGDAIDSKYNRLYEEKLNPFKLEELDRQAILTRMNIFERGLAFMIRNFFQDRWSRHAFLVYFCLVHFIALVYVVKVLNPELVEEIDSNMQTKWSTATMELDMQREHPDVRF